MPDDNDQLDPIQTAVPLASQTHPAATAAVAQGLLNIRDLPQRMIEASEGLRTTGQYDPAPSVELMQLLMGGGMPAAERYALGAAGGRMKTVARQFPEYATEYPKMAAGTPAIGKDTGRAYFEKTHTPESKAFMQARAAIMRDMEKSGYPRYYDPAKRAPIDPSVYPTQRDMAREALPRKPETIAKYRKMFDTPEARQRLVEAYNAGKTVPGSEHWYWMKQLYDDYIKELGPQLGKQKFQTDFAGAMAATTGGADPTSNLLMAHYANYMRSHGLPLPTVSGQEANQLARFARKQGAPVPDKAGDIAAYKVPYPVGGRYAGTNLKQYQEAFSDPNFTAFGADNPKRFDFQYSFLGNLDSATIDEQMSSIIVPGMKTPGDAYGIATQVVRDVAKEMGVDPQYFQDVAWAGFKKLKTEAKGKKFDYAGPMIEHINAAIERTHRLTGMAKDEIVRRGLIRGEIPLYGGAGLAAGAALKAQEGQGEP